MKLYMRQKRHLFLINYFFYFLLSLFLFSCSSDKTKLELAEKAQLELNNGNYHNAIKYSKLAFESDPLNINIRYTYAVSFHGLAKLRPTDLLKAVFTKKRKESDMMLKGVWGLDNAQRKRTMEALKIKAKPESFWLATEKMTYLNKAWKLLCPFIPQDIMTLYSVSISQVLEIETTCMGGLKDNQVLNPSLVTEIIINNFAQGTGLYQSFIDKDQDNVPDIIPELNNFSKDVEDIQNDINTFSGHNPTHYLNSIDKLTEKLDELKTILTQLILYDLEFVYLKTALELFKRFERNYDFLQSDFKELFNEFESTLDRLDKYLNFGDTETGSDFLNSQIKSIFAPLNQAAKLQDNIINSLPQEEKERVKKDTQDRIYKACSSISQIKSLLPSFDYPPLEECQ